MFYFQRLQKHFFSKENKKRVDFVTALSYNNKLSHKKYIYGGVPEWPKGADCKSVVFDFGGPNPPSPTSGCTHTLSVAIFFMAFFHSVEEKLIEKQ